MQTSIECQTSHSGMNYFLFCSLFEYENELICSHFECVEY